MRAFVRFTALHSFHSCYNRKSQHKKGKHALHFVPFVFPLFNLGLQFILLPYHPHCYPLSILSTSLYYPSHLIFSPLSFNLIISPSPISLMYRCLGQDSLPLVTTIVLQYRLPFNPVSDIGLYRSQCQPPRYPIYRVSFLRVSYIGSVQYRFLV